MLKHIKLQHLLFVAFTIIASLPVFILGYWVQRVALENEIEKVEEKHLLVAKNVTRDLGRYVMDVEAGIEFITSNLILNNKLDGVAKLLSKLDIRYICITDNNGNIQIELPVTNINKTKIGDKLWIKLQKTITEAKRSEKIVYSDLIRTGDDETTFFIVKNLGGNKLAVAALSTNYIKEAQKQISFGRRGHVAIVDRTGRAIAHPVAGWVKNMKDMSFLPPVQKMKQGKTGVSQFYTPAMNGDVIAGYTVVSGTGWGVMVPQPFEELEEHARSYQNTALVIIIIGITVAGLISWFFSVLLVGPIHSVVEAIKFDEDGENKFIKPAEITTSYNFIPKEAHELINSFNNMGSRLNATTEKLYSKIDFANKEVNEQNIKLKNQASDLKTINEELERLSTTDNLTGLFNRRLFDETLDAEFSFSVRHKEFLSLVMLDIDEFKSVNDKYGHAYGDKVLIDIADILKKNIRTSDVAFRIGGEEFTILCRKTDSEMSKIMVENLRKSLEQHEFRFADEIITVTGSFGIITIPDEDFIIENAESFYRGSDKAMYFSKHHGKNRVTHYHDIVS